MQSPFKFLDSFTKEDKDIFFGREKESGEIYSRIFQSKLLLVYGASGTGKTSLIQCGLANKFNDSDWLPILIRRGNNINESLLKNLKAVAITDLNPNPTLKGEGNVSSPSGRIKEGLSSLYLDHFKPIYLIFDQLEELFIFGSASEIQLFAEEVASVLNSELQCKFIFVIRGEYLEHLTVFENTIPTFFDNRIRIEKMTRKNATETITGPCKVAGITVEEQFPAQLLDSIFANKSEIELTYLQVFLDKLYKKAAAKNSNSIIFSAELLKEMGRIGDVLSDFLEEQISKIADTGNALVILKSFVSLEGTKKQNSIEEIIDFANSLGKNISVETTQNLLKQLVDLRILKDKDDNEKYELLHDSLATKIYEKITLVEKELIEVRQIIQNRYQEFLKRKTLLNADDLKFIAPFEEKLFLNENQREFLAASKKEIKRKATARQRTIIFVAIVLIAILSIFSIWATKERANAVEQKKIAEQKQSEAIKAKEEAVAANQETTIAKNKAEESENQAIQAKGEAEKNAQLALVSKQQAETAKQTALHAKEVAEDEIYQNLKNALVVSADKMNVLFKGLNNPISISASGLNPENIIPTIEKGKCELTGINGRYIAIPLSDSNIVIKVRGITKRGDTIAFGSVRFKVARVADPIPFFAGKTGTSPIRKNDLLFADRLNAEPNNTFFDVKFQVLSFNITIMKGGIEYSEVSEGARVSDTQRKLLENLKEGDKFFIENIKAQGPDGEIRQLAPIVLKVN